MKTLHICQIIPLTNRVREPYCKLRTEFFSLRASAINPNEKSKICNLQYGPGKTRSVRYLFYLLVKTKGTKILVQAERPLMTDARQILSTRAFYWLPRKTGLCVVKSFKVLVSHTYIMQNFMKRTGKGNKRFPQRTVIQRSVSNLLSRVFSTPEICTA